MSSFVVTATFTKNTGDVATGLTLADIDLYLTSINLSSGAVAAIWDGSQNPTVEVTNTGTYARIYSSADLDTYAYVATAHYTGATTLDADYATGALARDEATLSTAALALVQAEAEDALETYDLDHLIQVTAGSEEPTDGSYLDQVMHRGGSQTFNASTDSLEAIRDALDVGEVTTVSAVSGDTITVVPYTTWEFTVDGLADLSDALANGVFFTVKEAYTDVDSAAILQVQEGVGLVYLNGAAGTAAKATLTVGGTEDEITVHVNASQTGLAEQRDLVWDIKKVIEASEDADQMATGVFHIADASVTRALTTS